MNVGLPDAFWDCRAGLPRILLLIKPPHQSGGGFENKEGSHMTVHFPDFIFTGTAAAVGRLQP